MVLRPEGISKRTGKPYQPFWACPVRDDGAFCEQTARYISDDQAWRCTRCKKIVGYGQVSPLHMHNCTETLGMPMG